MKKVFRFMYRTNNQLGLPEGDYGLYKEKFESADAAWQASWATNCARDPWVFEETAVRDTSGACRESRSVSGHLAAYCDCLCCTASKLLEVEAERARQVDKELLGGISHDQLKALESFGMVRRVAGELAGPSVYEITHDGRVLLENCIESRR